MNILSTPTRYGAFAQFFHWLTVVLVGAAYLLSEGGPESRVYAPERALSLSLHETCGMLVIAVLVVRLFWRVIDHVPQDPPMPAWMRASARIVHTLLYVLLAAIPVTGIFGAWLGGHAVTFLGFDPIGPLGAPSRDLGEAVTMVHTNLGNIIVWLAGLHAAAALLHHFVLRDRVLLAMLPFGRIKSSHLAVDVAKLDEEVR